MSPAAQLLLLEDQPADAELILRELRKHGINFNARCVASKAGYLDALEQHPLDIILADYSIPEYDGFAALASAREQCPAVPFILVSGAIGEERAVEALRQGATDYVLKQRLSRLGPAVQRALAEAVERAKRQQTDEALRISEERFRSVWEQSLDGMRLADAEGRILEVNSAYCRLVKMSRDRLVGQMISVVYDPNGPDGDIDVYRSRFASGDIPRRLTPQLRLWNGERLEVEVSNSIVETDRAARTLLSLFHDLADRKRADREVIVFSRLGQQLSAATSAREAAEIIVTVADQLLGWDACTLDLYSREHDRLLHVLHRDTIHGRREEFASAYEDEPPSPLARRVMERGGELILKDRPDAMLAEGRAFGDADRPSAAIMLAPIREGAKVIGLFSVHSYTPNAYDPRKLETLQALADHCAGALERLAAQEALTQSETNYRLLVERSPDGILVHREGVFIYANAAGLKLFGAEKAEQLVGRSMFEFVPPDRHSLVKERIRDVASGGTAPAIEQRLQRLDGGFVEVETTSMPFIYESRPAVQTIMRDVSGRKQLEQQLRQAQKMEAVGQLAGGVAHDFNNLLAVMRGNAELLLLDAKAHPPDTLECLKQITAASERAANLTRQLLAFSRKQVMQARPVILNDVVADLTKMLKRIIGEHIDLQCQYAARLPFVQADPGMIEQVLVNLAVNARDAMPRGGQLLITTEAMQFEPAHKLSHPDAREGSFVCLTVKDAGTGIAPEHLPHIFEPFFTTKERGKGTGLGLATVYGIVKQHLGWIDVASQPGAGATFRILLPVIAAPAGTARQAPAEAALPGGTETILLVEDDYAVRMITRRVLESHGYKIYEASSARQGRELWQSRAAEIDLLLSDIVMPEGVSGRDLAEQLRAERPNLRVVLMNGYSADVIGKNADFFRRSRTYFLQKPCPSRTLLETVRRCLDAKEPDAKVTS